MSINSSWSFDIKRKRDGHGGVPLRTVAELAEELGTNVSWLGRRMAADVNGPRPKINNKNKYVINRTTWYDPQEVRKWWAARKANE